MINAVIVAVGEIIEYVVQKMIKRVKLGMMIN